MLKILQLVPHTLWLMYNVNHANRTIYLPFLTEQRFLLTMQMSTERSQYWRAELKTPRGCWSGCHTVSGGKKRKDEKKFPLLSAVNQKACSQTIQAPYPAPQQFVSHDSQRPPINLEGVACPAVQEGMENLRGWTERAKCNRLFVDVSLFLFQYFTKSVCKPYGYFYALLPEGRLCKPGWATGAAAAAACLPLLGSGVIGPTRGDPSQPSTPGMAETRRPPACTKSQAGASKEGRAGWGGRADSNSFTLAVSLFKGAGSAEWLGRMH